MNTNHTPTIEREMLARGWSPESITAEKMSAIARALRRQANTYRNKSKSSKAAECIRKAAEYESAALAKGQA